MKKLYKKALDFFFQVPIKIETLKTLVAEWTAILRKAPLYKDIKWSKEQQKEFDAFWKENYGKKISNRWHKLYEASNGVHRIDYLPEIIYSTKIEPKLNNYTYCSVFADKNLNGLFFDNRINGVRTPKCFLSNISGQFYDNNRHLISKDSAIELLGNVGTAVIKPSVDSSSGKNVAIIDMHEGRNKRNGLTAQEILKNYKSNFIVQEKICPCDELATLYPKSINTLRVISYIIDDNVSVAPISLRIGGNGGEVDNIHAGGMSIAVKNTGELEKYAYRLCYGDSFEKFEMHPDTETVFDGYKLSFTDRLISTAKCLHEITANIGIISWDFTVDSDGNIVIIEANFTGQSVWFPQMLSGNSLFGKNTSKLLSAIKN